MSKCSLALLLVITMLVAITPSDALEKDWTYTLQQIESNTTDESLVKAVLRAARTAPGVYGINGSLFIGKDCGEDYEVEARLMRSASGSNEFKMTPFQLPKSSLKSFMNKSYKKFIMNDLKECSTLPVFEDEWQLPLKGGEYKVNSCVIGTDNFPTHLEPGLYKVIFEAKSPAAHFFISFLCRVESKMPKY